MIAGLHTTLTGRSFPLLRIYSRTFARILNKSFASSPTTKVSFKPQHSFPLRSHLSTISIQTRYFRSSSPVSNMTLASDHPASCGKHKVAIVGSGNWGSTIAKIVAENTEAHPETFQKEIKMWVHPEKYQLPESHPKYDSSKHAQPLSLTELINDIHENPKYLPNIALPAHIIATESLKECVEDASFLVFNIPHQFVPQICTQINGYCLPYARAVSCIKGVSVSEDGISLFSDAIGKRLGGIYCGALSGANIASEVAQEKFSETTIGFCPDESKLVPVPDSLPPVDHALVQSLFHRPYFHVRMIDDVAGVSLGGALKNVVALATGFVEGMGWGDNAKAAVMRVGLLEMRKFGKLYFAGSCRTATFTEESCGVADLITSCNGGRNHRCAKLAIERGQTVEEVEQTELNGQKLQGTLTAREVNEFLKKQGTENEFPLLTAVYNILEGTVKPEELPEIIDPKSPKRAASPHKL